MAEAVRGVDAIVHLASAPRKTRETDVEGTRRLLEAGRAAGVRHVLYISINGIDRVPVGYFAAKISAENVVRASGVPFTILRAAQFPSLIETVLKAAGTLGPVIVDRSFVFQTVDIEDVADRIADLLAAGPSGETTEFVGPQQLAMDEMARQWLAARGTKRPVWSVRVPGKTARAVREGALTSDAQPAGTRTWRDYLAARY